MKIPMSQHALLIMELNHFKRFDTILQKTKGYLSLREPGFRKISTPNFSEAEDSNMYVA